MLKEFDLDAPTLPRDLRQNFRLQTRSVTALCERLFVPFRTNNKSVWKVLVEVVPVITKPGVRDLLGVLTIQIVGVPENFLNAGHGDKSRMALEWLAGGVAEIAKSERWAVKQFEDAFKAVAAAGFINKWQWKRGLWNKGRTTSCDIEVEHAVDAARISAAFYDSDRLPVGEVLLVSTSPSEFAFVPCLGRAKWLDERCLELISKDGEHRWQAVAPEIPPVSRGERHQNHLPKKNQ